MLSLCSVRSELSVSKIELWKRLKTFGDIWSGIHIQKPALRDGHLPFAGKASRDKELIPTEVAYVGQGNKHGGRQPEDLLLVPAAPSHENWPTFSFSLAFVS